jgi:4-amino-4-deoxy-L-arabinose transferase-like glycosyltransferase
MTFDLKRIKGSLQLRAGRMLAAPPGAAVASWISRFEVWFVLAAAVGFVLKLVHSSLRPFWFDELFTFYIARLPHIGQLFQAIPADGNPPLNYLLARLCLRLFGETELATRLPSILAFAAGMLAVYFFVRRRCGAVPALFGMFTLATSEIATFGSEARPYALLLGFTGMTMVSWQAATEEGRARLIPLIGVAVGIAGAIASHHYGAFHAGVPLMFGEAVRLANRRRFDFPLYFACAAGLSMIAVTAPFARETHQIMLNYVRDSVTFWAKPHLRNVGTYQWMVDVRLLFIFLAVLWLTNSAFKAGDETGQSGRENDSIAAHEIAAAIGLALLLPIMVGITWIATGYYLPRYAIGAAMGIAILMGMAAQHLGWNASHGSAAAALCMVFALLAFAGPRTYAVLDRLTKSPVDSAPGQSSVLDAARGQEPIVVASALAYMPKWWYASPPLRARLHYLADLPFAVRQPDFLPELSLVANQPYVASKVDDYRRFLAVNREFYLYCVGTGRLEWTKERLRAEGWTLHLLASNGQETLSLVQAPSQ